jgi:AmpD protein
VELELPVGLLKSAKYLPSNHCDDRPENQLIDMIVIHNISLPPGEFGTGSVEKFFCDQLDVSQHPFFSTIHHLKVAAHLFINREGAVTQFVPFSKRAWHAGQSIFQGRERCNDFSIGIELEGTDHIPFEEKQYVTLSQIIRLLMKIYPAITRERIVGHSDIAPQRKTDPGPAFDWNFLDCLLQV